MGNDRRSKQLMSNDGDEFEGFGKSGHDITEIVDVPVITVLYSPCLIIVCPAARTRSIAAIPEKLSVPRHRRCIELVSS